MHIYVEILKYLYLFLGLLLTATMFCPYVPDDVKVESIEVVTAPGFPVGVLCKTYKQRTGNNSKQADQDKYHAERTKEYKKEQAELKQAEEQQRLC